MGLREGMRTAPSLGNINNDTLLDMVIGNYSGGVSLFMGDITTGINDATAEAGWLTIYPNPAGEFVNIRITSENVRQAEMSIYNMLGQEITRMKITTNSNIQLQVSDLPAGMYYCKVIVNSTELVKKFIVQH